MFTVRYEPPSNGSKMANKTTGRYIKKLKKLEKSRSELSVHKENVIEKNEDLQSLKRKRDADSSSDSNESSSDNESSSENESSIEDERSIENENEIEEITGESVDIDVEMTDVTNDENIEENKAHSLILSRFKKVMQKQVQSVHDESIEEEEVERKDVAPLPQLKLPRDKQLYSQIHKNKNLDWLTKPAFFDSNLRKPFVELDPKVHPVMLHNLQSEFGVKEAFSVQITLIQELLKDINRGTYDPTPRGDYLINAATGSGKTLSYLIPIVQYILGDKNQIRIRDCGLKSIIIVPTKPLVQQVYSDLLKLTKGTDLNVMALKSGGGVSIAEESSKLGSNMVDILIATPGRLVEHLEILDLKSLRFLVVDEADRLLNQNFQDWCDLIMNKIESMNTIKLVFRLRCIKIILSATLTTNSEKLTHLRLFKPRLVVMNTADNNELYQLPKTLGEKVIRISEKLSYFKPLILIKLFQWLDKDNNKYDSFGIVFTKSNESTIKLNKLLNEIVEKFQLKLRINCINSSMKNQERSKILKDFDTYGGILICTDLLSRGINLTSVKFVVNYELPGSTKEYIHRIGRTARAGNFGNAVTLCFGENEFKWFKRIVYSGQQINRNGKNITDVKFVKELSDVEESDGDGDGDVLEVNFSETDKRLYDECLKVL